MTTNVTVTMVTDGLTVDLKQQAQVVQSYKVCAGTACRVLSHDGEVRPQSNKIHKQSNHNLFHASITMITVTMKAPG